MILYAEVECMIYEVQSLKEKRSIIKRLIFKIKNESNVAISELAFHDKWNRIRLGIVTISNEKTHAEQVIQHVLKTIDGFGEIERTLTNVEWV